MIARQNIIIIGSTGRNTGKTEFACRLIKKYSSITEIIGVKVVTIDPDEGNCPRGGKGCGVCTSLDGDFEITEETQILPDKDTSRMLMAGAQRVFFLKVSIHSLEKGITALLELIPEKAMAIFESNSIRKVIEPALFLVIRNTHERGIKESCAEVIGLADKVIDFHNMDWSLSPERILIRNGTWIIRENATAIILAGGKSSRMGGNDKSLLPVNGVPMIAIIVNQLEDHFDEIIIGANDSEKYSFLNKRVVADAEVDKGPLMGIFSTLDASESDVNFVTACDIPEMNIKLIGKMINFSAEFEIVMPSGGTDMQEPLFAVYRKSVAQTAKKILDNNGRRIIELLQHAKFKYVDFTGEGWYQNLNYKEDYITYVNSNTSRECRRDMHHKKD